jgi:DNA-binding transcriptional ArsR family regulator
LYSTANKRYYVVKKNLNGEYYKERIVGKIDDYIKNVLNGENKAPIIKVNQSLKNLNSNLMKVFKESLECFQKGAIIYSIIDEKYLSNFNHPMEFDESTIRKKLAEYEKQGLVEISKDGNKSVYSLKKNIALINHSQNGLQNALDFSSEILPMGILGSTLLDKMESHENCFRFKHHYITQSMDSEIMLKLFDAIKQKRWVEILTYNERKT